MKHVSAITLLATACVWLGGMTTQAEEAMMKSVYDFEMTDIKGNTVPLSQYNGKVTLIVNVASKCGFTKQYGGLQNLYATYKDQGLVVMGFPANNFGRQEPGSNEEIQLFCSTRFDVTFPMFAKISVKGDDIHPLYSHLTSSDHYPALGGPVGWNFTKFLVDGQGNVIARFGSRDTPEGDKMVTAIEAALNKAP